MQRKFLTVTRYCQLWSQVPFPVGSPGFHTFQREGPQIKALVTLPKYFRNVEVSIIIIVLQGFCGSREKICMRPGRDPDVTDVMISGV
jgi:hypothetical protein